MRWAQDSMVKALRKGQGVPAGMKLQQSTMRTRPQGGRDEQRSGGTREPDGTGHRTGVREAELRCG
jgi:hypothetical protein